MFLLIGVPSWDAEKIAALIRTHAYPQHINGWQIAAGIRTVVAEEVFFFLFLSSFFSTRPFCLARWTRLYSLLVIAYEMFCYLMSERDRTNRTEFFDALTYAEPYPVEKDAGLVSSRYEWTHESRIVGG